MEISLYPAYNVLVEDDLSAIREMREDIMCIGGTSQWPATLFRGIDQWGERYGYLLVDPIGGAIGAFSHRRRHLHRRPVAHPDLPAAATSSTTSRASRCCSSTARSSSTPAAPASYRGGLSAETCFIPHRTDVITQDTLSSGNAIPTSHRHDGRLPGDGQRLQVQARHRHPAAAGDGAMLIADIAEVQGRGGGRCSCGRRTSCSTRPTSTR